VTPAGKPQSPDPTPPGAPRWVKVFAIIVAVVVVAIVILALAGGEHGPSRHMLGADDRGRTAPVQHSP
jgi:hypothetical protein